MAEPNMWFSSENEMLDCMEKWKSRLGLTDWYIAGRICGVEDLSNPEFAGESEVQHENMCGLVSLRRKEEIPSDSLCKQPQELTLIHELLHFKFISFEPKNREEAFFEIKQHQMIECLARALFMAEYNLKWEWFITDCHRNKADKE